MNNDFISLLPPDTAKESTLLNLEQLEILHHSRRAKIDSITQDIEKIELQIKEKEEQFGILRDSQQLELDNLTKQRKEMAKVIEKSTSTLHTKDKSIFQQTEKLAQFSKKINENSKTIEIKKEQTETGKKANEAKTKRMMDLEKIVLTKKEMIASKTNDIMAKQKENNGLREIINELKKNEKILNMSLLILTPLCLGYVAVRFFWH